MNRVPIDRLPAGPDIQHPQCAGLDASTGIIYWSIPYLSTGLAAEGNNVPTRGRNLPAELGFRKINERASFACIPATAADWSRSVSGSLGCGYNLPLTTER